MDYEKLLCETRKGIESLPHGQTFLVKDLFRGTEWSKLSPGDKRGFGRCFKNMVLNKKVAGVRYVGKADNNSAQYQVIVEEE